MANTLNHAHAFLKVLYRAEHGFPLVVHVRHLFLEDCVEYRTRFRKPRWMDWQMCAPGRSKLVANPYAQMATYFCPTSSTGMGLAGWRESSEIAAATIHKLFSHLAGTLQHVCFIQHLSPLATFGRVRLPALVELTYSCAYDGLRLCEVDEPYYLTIMEDAPALLRLHYVSIEGKQSPSRVIALGAPMLTHFRHSSTLNVVRTLNALRAEAAQPGWPPRLETIQISPVVSYRRPVAIRSDSFAGWSMWALQRAASTAVDISMHVHLTEENVIHDSRKLYHEWIDRLQGGYGCWIWGSSILLSNYAPN